jgi:hypothetical protein
MPWRLSATERYAIELALDGRAGDGRRPWLLAEHLTRFPNDDVAPPDDPGVGPVPTS